jgi:hypothetical protein
MLDLHALVEAEQSLIGQKHLRRGAADAGAGDGQKPRKAITQ